MMAICPTSRYLGAVFARVAIIACFITLSIGCLTFDDFEVPSTATVFRASAGIVFSGHNRRIEAGLQLVQAGLIPRLYISGTDLDDLHQTLTRLTSHNPKIPDREELLPCCVQWSALAKNTLQNARDAACWIEREKLAEPIILITSKRHMARSFAALSSMLPHHRIVPYPTPDEDYPDTARTRQMARLSEYVKYLVTLAAVSLPLGVGSTALYGPLAEPCAELKSQ